MTDKKERARPASRVAELLYSLAAVAVATPELSFHFLTVLGKELFLCFLFLTPPLSVALKEENVVFCARLLTASFRRLFYLFFPQFTYSPLPSTLKEKRHLLGENKEEDFDIDDAGNQRTL